MRYEKIQIKRLFDKAKKDLQKTLSTYSGDRIKPLNLGLKDLLSHFDTGLRGDLPPNYYLSSVDPGIEKTESYCSFIKSWKEMRFIPEGSILVAVATLEEIPSIISRCGLDKEDYACLTGDGAINGMGRGETRIDRARVAFTTQAMIRSRTAGKSFANTKDFHYLGVPRSLRIWDEGFQLATSVTVSLHDLTALSHSMRSTNPDLFAALDELANQMIGGAANDCIAIPGKIASLASAAKLPNETDQKTVSKLASVAGTPMVLRTVGGTLGRVLVGASAPLPADFAPAVILDASGRVRGTYTAQKAGIGNLVRLTPSVRDYANVRVHVCKTTAGKAGLAFDAGREQIYRASAKIIDSKPEEEWLVISYKSDKDFDIESELKGYVGKPGNIRFLSWGRHHGTNEFRDCKNILIIGSYLYSSEGYHALELAASGLSASAFSGPSKQFAADELASNILQAVMRSNARRGTEGIAGDCQLYWFASKAPDPFTAIRKALPNCDVKEWNALDRPLAGLARNVLGYIENHFSVSGAPSLTKSEVQTAVGIKHLSGLSRIINKPLFIDHLGRKGFRMINNGFIKAS